ncbi:hypothetical protein DACRYDRAFT_22885 [Dacryopinax primogenitus]|uniref:Uncharacterized protein n=1 Tax=Dacryopinax primogenitus (strain DJM 731) TaxID=1858805 RepID=M5GAY4_DACPD|nr:uncharacterized protein DACRYDRAFT_22885 [Dacryopinax primogenitus]EJU01103.1 hypothetical protein DACRYDRAFT_22885 [Dacryopinax primogenitus]
MDELTEMTTYTTAGAVVGQWLLGITTMDTIMLVFILSYVRGASAQGSRRLFGWLPPELLGQAGIAIGLTFFDYLYFVFRDMRFVSGVVWNAQTNVTLAMYYIDATNWRFTASVVVWLCKTAFADCVMLLRAIKLFHNNERLGGQFGYYSVLALLSLLYLGTVASGVVTWVGLLRPEAATFDTLLEKSATFFMSIHCGYNTLVTLLISFVYWRAMSHEFKMMTVAQLALRSFSAGNMMYTLLITVLVVLYQRQILFVYFWYDITQPLMTMSFTVPMLLTAFARILPAVGTMKSTNMTPVRGPGSGISVAVRREEILEDNYTTDSMPMHSLSPGEGDKQKAFESDEDA